MKSHLFSFKTFKKLLSLNEIISVDEWYNKFQNTFSTISLQIVKDIVNADPTSNDGKNKGLYSEWLVNLYKKNNLKLEDLYKAKEYLTIFDKIKNKLSNRDINFYKTLPDLFLVIKPYQETPELILSNRERSGKTKIDNEIQLFYEDEYIKVQIPLTYRASCFLGSGTEWCTATGKTDEYYNNYIKSGNLYIIFDKKQNKKYQFFFPEKEYMDANDNKIKDFSFLENSYNFFEKLKNIEFNLYTLIESLMENLNFAHVKIIKFFKGYFDPQILSYLLNTLCLEILESSEISYEKNVLDIMNFYVKNGADLNYFSKNENRLKATYPYPIISRLIYLKNLIYLEKFLEYKPNVNIRYDILDMTPLMVISTNIKNKKIAELLLKAGADPNLKNKNGYNSAFIAIPKNNFSIEHHFFCNIY
jgi:hypothetical protein